MKSAVRPNQFIKSSLPAVAFAGKSNVGKSSVINRLLNRKNFARVGATPGKTIHVNYFLIEERLYLIDLPGYGYAKVSQSERERWGKLMEQFFAEKGLFTLGVLIVDARHKPTADDVTMINFLIDAEIPFVIVLTKADKLKKTERQKRREAFLTEIPCAQDITFIEFSAQTGEGADEIRGIIDEAVNG